MPDLPQQAGEAYSELLGTVKGAIRQARIRAARTVNRELIGLYWNIGREIAERSERAGWGKGIVEKLSRDLSEAFPDSRGFSPNSLWSMQQLYLEYRESPILPQLVGEIPWGHNRLIINKVKSPGAREYYLRMSAEQGWSRNVLLHQIQSQAFERHREIPKQHNFADTLPQALAEQADEAMKDIYVLDFLGIARPVLERELERRMIGRIRDVILELGYGFSFIGNQYRLALGEKEYFIDLLFYHRKLKSLVAVELKAGAFQPEYAGKMNLYLNLLDDFVREPGENPSIGIILCADRDRVEVEYSLRGIDKPMGVSGYTLTRDLPAELAGKLPDAGMMEAEILKELAAEEEAGKA
ncbi:MAG TPA: PDDEXK nuclease domain-containing protein [Candidatus Deferrimicrobiaceae bacterium]|jgi:predicted nuclease of restriction endonuclease-like (RecB) superfamily